MFIDVIEPSNDRPFAREREDILQQQGRGAIDTLISSKNDPQCFYPTFHTDGAPLPTCVCDP